MKSLNRAINICARVFAALLIAGIVLSAVSLISGVSLLTSGSGDYKAVKSDTYELVTALDVDIDAAELIIRNGEGYGVETDNNNVDFSLENGVLKIKESSTFGIKKSSTVIITVPATAIFNEIDIDTGAGKLTVAELNAIRFSLEIGAGDTEIQSLKVSSSADISAGMGELSINDGSIHNLDLELGMGDVDITAAVMGESEIDCGMGDLKLKLLGGKSLYRIACFVGLGDFKIDGEKVKSGELSGNGANSIRIEGGMGSGSVVFEACATE